MVDQHIVINDLPPLEQYVMTEGQTVVPIPFPFFEDGDIKVYEGENGTPISSALYTITGAGESAGGSFEYLVGKPAGTIVTVERVSSIKRTSDFTGGGDWTAKNVNDQLDKLTTFIQEVKYLYRRTIKLPVFTTLSEIFLPAPEAGKAIRWNDDGTGLINTNFNPDASADIAVAAAATATTQAGIATTQAGTATTQAGISTTQAINSFNSAQLSEDWAIKMDAPVESSEYSSKWHATQAAQYSIFWLGQWVAGTYQKNQAVTHNGSSYVANTTTTQEPSDVATDWDILALQGADGTGTTADQISVDNSGTDFSSTEMQGVVNEIDADFARLDRQQAFTKGQASTPVALTMGSTVNVDLSLSNYFTLQIAATDFTLANPTNAVQGTSFIIDMTQAPGLARLMTLDTNYITQDGEPIVIPSTLSGNFLLYGLVDKNDKIKIALTPIWEAP